MNEACSNKLITVHQLLADWSITIPLDRYAKCTVSATYARWFRVTSSWVCVFLYVCVRLSLSLCVSQSTHIFSHQLVHWKVDCSAVLLLFVQKEDADLMGARHFLRPEYSVSWKENPQTIWSTIRRVCSNRIKLLLEVWKSNGDNCFSVSTLSLWRITKMMMQFRTSVWRLKGVSWDGKWSIKEDMQEQQTERKLVSGAHNYLGWRGLKVPVMKRVDYTGKSICPMIWAANKQYV